MTFLSHRVAKMGYSILACYLDDRYLSLQDTTFIELVEEDVADFVASREKNRVLLFPPVNSYQRLLIHKTVQQNLRLHSFSVGEGDGRQTVVCWKESLISDTGDSMSGYNPPPPRGRGRGRLRDRNSPSPTPGTPVSTLHGPAPTQTYTRAGLSPGQWRDGDGEQRARDRGDDVHAFEETAVIGNQSTQHEQVFPEDADVSRYSSRQSRAQSTDSAKSVMDAISSRPQRARNKRPDIQVYVPRGRRSQNQPSQPGGLARKQSPSVRDERNMSPNVNDRHYSSGDGCTPQAHNKTSPDNERKPTQDVKTIKYEGRARGRRSLPNRMDTESGQYHSDIKQSETAASKSDLQVAQESLYSQERELSNLKNPPISKMHCEEPKIQTYIPPIPQVMLSGNGQGHDTPPMAKDQMHYCEDLEKSWDASPVSIDKPNKTAEKDNYEIDYTEVHSDGWDSDDESSKDNYSNRNNKKFKSSGKLKHSHHNIVYTSQEDLSVENAKTLQDKGSQENSTRMPSDKNVESIETVQDMANKKDIYMKIPSDKNVAFASQEDLSSITIDLPHSDVYNVQQIDVMTKYSYDESWEKSRHSDSINSESLVSESGSSLPSYSIPARSEDYQTTIIPVVSPNLPPSNILLVKSCDKFIENDIATAGVTDMEVHEEIEQSDNQIYSSERNILTDTGCDIEMEHSPTMHEESTCIQMERTSPTCIDSMNMDITDSNKIKTYSSIDETPTDRSHHLCKSGETTEDQYEGTDFTIHEHDKTSEPSVNNIDFVCDNLRKEADTNNTMADSQTLGGSEESDDFSSSTINDILSVSRDSNIDKSRSDCSCLHVYKEMQTKEQVCESALVDTTDGHLGTRHVRTCEVPHENPSFEMTEQKTDSTGISIENNKTALKETVLKNNTETMANSTCTAEENLSFTVVTTETNSNTKIGKEETQDPALVPYNSGDAGMTNTSKGSDESVIGVKCPENLSESDAEPTMTRTAQLCNDQNSNAITKDGSGVVASATEATEITKQEEADDNIAKHSADSSDITKQSIEPQNQSINIPIVPKQAEDQSEDVDANDNDSNVERIYCAGTNIISESENQSENAASLNREADNQSGSASNIINQSEEKSLDIDREDQDGRALKIIDQSYGPSGSASNIINQSEEKSLDIDTEDQDGRALKIIDQSYGPSGSASNIINQSEEKSLDIDKQDQDGRALKIIDQSYGPSGSASNIINQSEEKSLDIDIEDQDGSASNIIDQSDGQSDDERSWDAMFDDNGDCLDPSAMEELTKTVGKVKIQKSKKINYLEYQPKDKAELDYSEYGHIIEIYDFPKEFVTRDLIAAFQSFMSRGFDLKWVDDTHALGIFSSAIAARDALDLVHPLLKVCPLSEATKQSKVKARNSTEFLQPYKPRPVTSATAARRLVAGALGLATNISREKRDLERKQLKEAKEKRRQDKKNKEDIWEGTFGRCAMDEES